MTSRNPHPALRYHGGKHRLAAWITSHFPPHKNYVEPFGGGASVLLRKEPSPIEVYNDLDSRVVTFFRMLRDQPDALINAINLTPYSRAEERLSHERSDDPLEEARRFFILCWQSRGGISGVGGWRFRNQLNKSRPMPEEWQRLDHLWQVAARLKRVHIEQAPALHVTKRLDQPDTLFYVDPPYVHAARRNTDFGYAHEMTLLEHARLLRHLRSLKGMVILSSYPHPLYERLLHDWQRIECQTRINSNEVATELLWLSPNATQYSYLPLFAFSERVSQPLSQ